MTEENPDANGYMFYGFSDAEPATLFKDVNMLAACKFNFNPDSMVSYETSNETNVYLINDTVKHPYQSLTSEAITNYLSQYTKVIPAAASVHHFAAIKGNMNQYTAFFNENFGDGTVQWPFALFSSDEFLTRLYAATGGENNFGGIRYYFGLDKAAKENRLRIVIFAVNKSGSNVVADNRILERHVVPHQNDKMDPFLTRMSATCIEVLVALFGLMIFKKAGLLFRLLILLLLYGAATDIFGWTFYKLNRSYVLIAVDIYTLAEALLMVFIIESTGLFNKLKHIFKLIYLLLLFAIYWHLS
ncbi:MAG: hypothetical protein IPJ93_07505 [Bacteroidota bacterium]|nr:MAG: hypothetical protein IPJ93_07505 [Bacteroidota bacterium]